MRIRIATLGLFLIATALAGCSKEDSKNVEALPAASDWQAPPPMASKVGPGSAHASDPRGGATGGSDPHAGMDMGGADPHAGLDMGGTDPHAGLDMGGADPHAGLDMGGADPHAGLDMGGADPHGGDPQMAAVQPPDPNRSIDESKFLRGKIVATAKTRSLVKSGAILFLSVRPINPATGEIIGSPIAVDRVDVGSLPVEFNLSGRNAMSAGTHFEGDVLIIARVDGDGEARSRSPGDVEGQLRAKIPADKLTLELDSILR